MSIVSDSALIKDKALINNQWVNADDNTQIDVTNPFDNRVISTIPNLSHAQVVQAVDYATSAQVSWAKMTAKQRGDLLNQWADLIDQRARKTRQ